MNNFWSCMILTALFLCTSLGMGARAEEFSPSVWNQLQRGDVSSAVGKITSLEIGEQGLSVGFTSKVDGQSRTLNTKFCSDAQSAQSEAFLAAQAVVRSEILREAFKSGENVEMTFDGPWSPCLRSVRIQRNLKRAIR